MQFCFVCVRDSVAIVGMRWPCYMLCVLVTQRWVSGSWAGAAYLHYRHKTEWTYISVASAASIYIMILAWFTSGFRGRVVSVETCFKLGDVLDVGSDSNHHWCRMHFSAPISGCNRILGQCLHRPHRWISTWAQNDGLPRSDGRSAGVGGYQAGDWWRFLVLGLRRVWPTRS